MRTISTTILGFLGASALAAPTGLIMIPIADILRHREVSAVHTVTGFERNVDTRYLHSGGLTVGLFDRVEVGVSSDYAGTETWDAKLLLTEGEHKGIGYAASVGIANGFGKSVDPYFAGRVDFKKLRLHGGVWRLSNVVQGFAGLDYELNESWVLMADHIGGREGYTWVAASYDLGAGLSVMGTFGRPNTRSDGFQHQVVITYTVKF
ncbi:MAG: hypothetical protein JNM04_05270 [Chthonomonas sp.]|nr:hypothetical protein [Chthonomonas sp.]